MEKAGGRVVRARNATNMKEIIASIRSMVLAFSHGQVATFTKESTKKTKEMAMER